MNRTRTRRRALVAAAVAVASLAAAGAAGAATHAAAAQATSSNWAGYAVTGDGQTFTDVKATWVEPAVTCPARGSSYSSFWVGLGGFASSSTGLEQIGSSVDCRNGAASTYSWYELIPAPAVDTGVAISAGDTVSAEVSAAGTAVTLSLTNVTTGQSFSTTQTVASPDFASAEWIAEAPSQCVGAGVSRCSTLPLVPFGTATFSGASVTGNGTTGTITGTTWTPTAVQLVPRIAGSASAAPGALSTDGTSFAVTTAAVPAAPATPATPPATTRPSRPGWGGRGYGRWGWRGGHR